MADKRKKLLAQIDYFAKQIVLRTVSFLANGITGGPIDHGFESRFGIIASLDMPPYVYFRDRTPVAIPTKFVPKKSPFGNREGLADPNLSPYTVLGDITHESVTLINAHDPAEPLFLYMALNAPHSPVTPSSATQCMIHKSGNRRAILTGRDSRIRN